MSKIPTISRESEFGQVFSSGKVYPAQYFVLYVLPNGTDANRYGFTAGKKVGNAVVRNRLKRLLKEVVRLHGKRLKKGFDFVLVARSAGTGRCFHDIEKDFCRLVDKNKLVSDVTKGRPI